VIARLEAGVTDARSSTVASIRSAFKTAGLRLVDDDGGWFGVFAWKSTSHWEHNIP